MKTDLFLQVIQAHPELRPVPRSHHEVITEPLELSSGLANANIQVDENGRPRYWRGEILKVIDNLPEFTPGTFASVKGRLRKARTKSTLVQHRWHDPAGPSKTRRWNPGVYQHLPSVKEMEARKESEAEKLQRANLRRLKVPSTRQRLLREHGPALLRKAERLLRQPDPALLRGEALPPHHALRRFLASQPVPSDLEGICVRLATLSKHI